MRTDGELTTSLKRMLRQGPVTVKDIINAYPIGTVTTRWLRSMMHYWGVRRIKPVATRYYLPREGK
jgi:hypothetical protein